MPSPMPLLRAFDYKAVAAGIARSEGMGALLPVVEKELLHYRILSAMQRNLGKLLEAIGQVGRNRQILRRR